MYGAALQPRASGYGASIAPAQERTARLRAAYGPALAGPAGTGYGPGLEPPETDAAERDLPAYGAELASSRGAYGPDLARALPARRPQRPPWGELLRGPAGGTYGTGIEPHIDALAPEEPPEEEEPELRTVAAIYRSGYARLRDRDRRHATGWRGSALDRGISADHRAVHRRRFAEQTRSGYKHTLEGTTEAMGRLDFTPRHRSDTRARFRTLPGPPAGSPRRDPELTASYRRGEPRDHDAAAPYDPRLPARTDDQRAPWSDPRPVDPLTRAEHSEADQRTRDIDAPWEVPRPLDFARRGAWDEPRQADALRRHPFRFPPPRDTARDLPYQDGRPLAGEQTSRWHNPPARDERVVAPWGPRPAGYICETRGGWPDAGRLVLNLGAKRPEGKEEPRRITPPGEAPVGESAVAWTSTASARRASDGADVPLERISITTDQDSFCWSWEAVSPSAAAKRVQPTDDGPGELVAEINGQRWSLIVEGYTVEREHGRTVRRLSGRSRAAWLDRPHAPARAREQDQGRDLRQLADEELEFTDYRITWDAADWHIPGGTWSYAAKPPAKAIARLAKAAGAFVYDRPPGRELVVRPRYPVSPPDWDTAGGRAIPVSLVTRAEGRWERDPRRHSAWVTGSSEGGVAVRCYRPSWHELEPGTPEPPAHTVTDALITDPQGGRARGTAEIDASGPKLIDTVTLPLGEPLELIEPGEMVRIYDARLSLVGLARSVRVEARLEDGAPTVAQVVELETRPEGFTRRAPPAPPYEPKPGDGLVVDLTERLEPVEVCEWFEGSGPRDRGIILPAPSGIIEPVEV